MSETLVNAVIVFSYADEAELTARKTELLATAGVTDVQENIPSLQLTVTVEP